MTAAAATSVRVLVAGGGVAALETVLALQALAGDRVTVELLAPDRNFIHRPLAVGEPFSNMQVRRFPLAALGAERNVRIHRDALARVRPDDRVVETQGGDELGYDTLVLALGARVTEAVPGALTFRGPQDAQRIRALIGALREHTIRRVAFVIPTGTTWAPPIYDLALHTAAAVREFAPEARLTVVTAERTPLGGFGDAAAANVAALLAGRGVSVRTATHVDEFVDGELRMGAQRLPFDRVIALPRLVGPHVRGVPSDPLGFVPVDEQMRVLDADGVYAIGDVAAQGVRQAGRARAQAAVAAAAIATAGSPAAALAPRPRAIWSPAWTGSGS
jgi:sulfide:quinone oxidoreductase